MLVIIHNMEKLKEVSFDDIILENPDNKKEDIIDDKYVKRAVINSNLDADVKIYILEKILQKPYIPYTITYQHPVDDMNKNNSIDISGPYISYSDRTSPVDLTCNGNNINNQPVYNSFLNITKKA